MKRLPVLASLIAMLPLAACAATVPPPSPLGAVTGRLVLEGGPMRPGGAQPGQRPIPGTVRFSVARHRPIMVLVGSSGTFSARLPAGTYHVSGRSPRVTEVIDGADHEAPCSQPLTVTVTPGHTARSTVTCIVP
jgi:hypothetical protein